MKFIRLVTTYAKSALKLTMKKIYWKFCHNKMSGKVRRLWFILYKLHCRISEEDLSSVKSGDVISLKVIALIERARNGQTKDAALRG